MRKIAAILACALMAQVSLAVLPESVTITYYNYFHNGEPQAQTNATFAIPAATYGSYKFAEYTLWPPEGSSWWDGYPNGLKLSFVAYYDRIVLTHTGRNGSGNKTSTARFNQLDGTYRFSNDSYDNMLPLGDLSAQLAFGGIGATFGAATGNHTVRLETSDPNDITDLTRSLTWTYPKRSYSSFWASSQAPNNRQVYYVDAGGTRRNIGRTRTLVAVSDGGSVLFTNDVGAATFLNASGVDVEVRTPMRRVTLAPGEVAVIETDGDWKVSTEGLGVTYMARTFQPVMVTSTPTTADIDDGAVVDFSTSRSSATFENRTEYPLELRTSYDTFFCPTGSVISLSTTNGYTLATSAPASNRVEYLAPDGMAVRVTSTPAPVQMAGGQLGVTVYQDAWETVTFYNPSGRSIDVWTTYGIETIPPKCSRELTSLLMWKIRLTPQTRGVSLMSASAPSTSLGGTGSVTVMGEHGVPMPLTEDWITIKPTPGGDFATIDGYSTLLFGSDNVPIFGKENGLLHGYPPYFEEVWIVTEWAFEQSGVPIAYINSVAVCNGHATEHIIPYNITEYSNWSRWSNADNGYVIRFSMSLYNIAPKSMCTYRCWMRDDESVSAESVGAQSGMWHNFKLVYNPYRATGKKYKLISTD